MTESGVRRYGFHGLSYEYIASVLPRYDPALASGRVVVAHLGNGASLCGARGRHERRHDHGVPALDGLPMGTRCGAIDAGVVFYMLREMNLGADDAERFLYTRCGPGPCDLWFHRAGTAQRRHRQPHAEHGAWSLCPSCLLNCGDELLKRRARSLLILGQVNGRVARCPSSGSLPSVLRDVPHSGLW